MGRSQNLIFLAYFLFAKNFGTGGKCGREHFFPKAFSKILFDIQFIKA